MSDYDARASQLRNEQAGMDDHIIADPPLVIELPEPIEIEEELECLDKYKGGCFGAVELRPSLSGTGTAIARCDFHWEERLIEQERIEETYHVNSAGPPDWLDESYAGERWDDDY